MSFGFLIFAFIAIPYVALSVWLTVKYMKLFLGSLYPSIKSRAPGQLYVSDYYVLLGMIALYSVITGAGAARHSEDVALGLPLLLLYLSICWYISSRSLSQARVRHFFPRALGQFLFPLQIGIAIFYGFLTIPLAFGFASPIVSISFVLFLIWIIAWALFSKISEWIAQRADPHPFETETFARADSEATSDTPNVSPVSSQNERDS